ncbi:hypothetical protein JHK82_016895 [Glycine max]|nr:hypothetical protein JHK86_016942 [Glycine max]KAG5150014.1 hypothetical protein JHK82_016895 [Glycine max]
MQPLDYSSMDFITQVLSIRDKYSDIRVLCFRARLSFSRLNSLIRRAIRHNVRELDIEASTVCTDDYFNFPRCVIWSETLRVLKLKSGFRLPPSSILSNNHLLIQPFYNLKHLELHTGFNRSNVPGLILLFKSSRTLNTLILKIIHEYRIERKEWNRDLWGMTITEGEKSERVFSTTLGSAAKFMVFLVMRMLHLQSFSQSMGRP